jgi:hypothetical protein
MDIKRVVVLVVLLAGLVWAATSSPLAKRLFGGTTARRPIPPGAIGPSAAPPVGSQPVAPARAAAGAPLSAADLATWRQRSATAGSRDPFFTAEEEQALLAPKVGGGPAKKEAPPAPLPAYTVKAILISDAAKVAALDGRLVVEGEAIGEERVVEIRPDGVVLERGGQRRRLSLPGGSIPIAESGSRDKGGKGQ